MWYFLSYLHKKSTNQKYLNEIESHTLYRLWIRSTNGVSLLFYLEVCHDTSGNVQKHNERLVELIY